MKKKQLSFPVLLFLLLVSTNFIFFSGHIGGDAIYNYLTAESLFNDGNLNLADSYTAKNVEELENVFVQGELHPADLKRAVADRIVQLLEPVRSHFAGKERLIEEIEALTVTR